MHQMSAYQAFLHRNALPEAYLIQARQHFEGLLKAISHRCQQVPTVLVGINGCQASGKTTLADYLCTALAEEYSLNAVMLSIDDFYLTRDERQHLAKTVHPLFATRGVPGTHDVSLALETIAALKQVDKDSQVMIPRFNKAADDRFAKKHWDTVQGAVNVIVLEGWCVDTRAQDDSVLEEPANAFERENDPEAIWRRHSNKLLNDDYPRLFEQIDIRVMLKAPSFNSVLNWRIEQEEKLAQKIQQANKSKSQADKIDQHKIMDAEAVKSFIQYYQRFTEHNLIEMPARVDHLFQLDETRKIISYQQGRKSCA